MSIELNSEFKQAIKLMNAGKNLFITGKAGTGKSTLLKYWRDQSVKKNVAVLAPTGIAAINVGGQTLHSFSRFPPRLFYPEDLKQLQDEKKLRVIQEIKTIVIDEISMVSALLFDALDHFLKINRPLKNGEENTKPFGGCQVILIGDLYQLPPVIGKPESQAYYDMYPTPFFFSASAMKNFALIELTKIYRQTDMDFIQVLNNIRLGQTTQQDVIYLNQRVQISPDELCVTLAPTNNQVASINHQKLRQLKGKQYTYEAEITGNFKERDCPAEPVLHLKVGAQIIMVSNDSEGRWVNGTIGQITELDDAIITVELEDRTSHAIERQKWEMQEYEYDRKARKVQTKEVGTCKQYPIKLAWAITCHKSQGLTLSSMSVDLSSGSFFAHGQAYVTLSRASSFEGLHLQRPLRMSDLNKKVDQRVTGFFNHYLD